MRFYTTFPALVRLVINYNLGISAKKLFSKRWYKNGSRNLYSNNLKALARLFSKAQAIKNILKKII